MQIILGNPPSKSNCYRIVFFNGHASLAKTKALKQYEKDFYIQCNEYRDRNIEGYFEFHIKVFFQSQRQDLDNSMKILLDCCQSCSAIKNDNKCVKIVAEKYLDKNNPRVEFEIKEVKL